MNKYINSSNLNKFNKPFINNKNIQIIFKEYSLEFFIFILNSAINDIIINISKIKEMNT